MTITFELCDSLTKVLPAQAPRRSDAALSGLRGETLSFQTAWIDTMPRAQRAQILITVTPIFADGCPPEPTTLCAFQVGLVPANLPAPDDPDDGYFTTDPTLLPDPLQPLELMHDADAPGHTAVVQSAHRGWNSLWWDIEAVPGLVGIEIHGAIRARHGHFLSPNVEIVWKERLDVVVGNRRLPKPKLHNIQWFHADSIANYYDVEPWSDAHWRAVRAHMESCARMRVNTILTPVWTPPLDTAPHTYRRNVQLLGIWERDGRYTFDFTRLDTWLGHMRDAGLTGVEVPHLFTQWGAHACPRFWVSRNSDENPQPRFGWDATATSPEYRDFLAQLIPALRRHLAAAMGAENVWYHVSDEPEREHLESYRAARAVVSDMLHGTQVIDALGDPEFQNLVQTPIVATDAVPRFRECGIAPTWVYYCVAQDRGVANRFLAQHPNRHRALGFQLYQGRAEGFLHWAFNFYNTQYSLRALDPYRDTAAGGGFISGDTFVVYPLPGGQVMESLRHRMLRAAFDDLAVCQLAEELVGREAVLDVINPDRTLDYRSGWVSEAELLRRRAALNQLLAS
ncbi:DUF4091 domain-containing protein [Trueperella pyogenes]|uniref:DUF4091 domain-containing protein n=1 Tax=Trueperella pyogenes TaxID=1661 RepID=UPI002169EEDA|nr:DUF4091 domain-containing protein [Trueperella pyogenes]UVJ53549.1 DUF4091 domain-containing protein [Trueperella pyogenes]UVJ57583.1 DUF4091 domain-containing protein [Trueperella pyogenes]